MADEATPKSDEQEKKIPVFTVLKNDTILKNIFVLEKPPLISEPKSAECQENESHSVQEVEEILLVGRHPDCHITLEHPSISRFHLRIHSKSSLLKLHVMDLSSVHGTWVSGKKIEPGVRVELNEGDSLRLGVSSRVYRLHWVPLSRAYDLDDPFVPSSDALVPAEETEEEMRQDEQCLLAENNEIQSLVNDTDDMDSLSFYENSELSPNKTIPPAPPLLEYMTSSFSDELKVENGSLLRGDTGWSQISGLCSSSRKSVSFLLPVGEIENEQLAKENWNPEAHVLSEGLSESQRLESPARRLDGKFLAENLCSSEKILSLSSEPLVMESVESCLPTEIVIPGAEDQQFNQESQTSQSWKEDAKPTPVRSEQIPHLPTCFNSSLSSEQEGCPASEILKAIDPRSPLKDSPGQSETPDTESVNSFLHGGNALLETEYQQFDKENLSPSASFDTGICQKGSPEYPPVRSEQKSGLPSIWSRRGKPASVIQIQTGRSQRKSTKFETCGKVEPLDHWDSENKLISNILFTDLDGDEEETFTPDKENFTPSNILLRSMEKMGKSEKVNLNIQAEEGKPAFSGRKNQTTKVFQEQKSVRHASRKPATSEARRIVMESIAERMPFQSLLVGSTGNSKSEASVLCNTTVSSKSTNYAQTIEKNNSAAVGERKWKIVVDTTCLLNKESRKALQLLQGLKGTQLIVPRIVIRELDCMKQRGTMFRRVTDGLLALEWIEECMVNTKLWIHVQSAAEEGRPIATTPPASPYSQLSEGTGGLPGGAASSMPFSACRSLLEIVSPTVADHILECALLFRGARGDGQLVLLSNDVTLKIKAMAEGILCETAEDFRESLVNPFSERFLWADSSPRGPTWSCMDDVVLRERYNRCPLKKPSKLGEGAKGLKLILLHNSHYGNISVQLPKEFQCKSTVASPGHPSFQSSLEKVNFFFLWKLPL